MGTRVQSRISARVRSYEKLVVWQKAITLVIDVYRVTESLPPSERFGLVTQMRRAAVSIPSNIAEGHEREGRRDYIRMLGLARGSLAELETDLAIVRELGYLPPEKVRGLLDQTDDISRMLVALQRTLRTLPSKR